MKYSAVLVACASIVLGTASPGSASCDFIQVVTLGGAQVVVGWPLDTHIDYWIESTFTPSGIVSALSSAGSTWDIQCNRLTLSTTPIYVPNDTKGQVVPIQAGWADDDSVAAHTKQYGFPVMNGFRVEINFQNFKRSGWSTAGGCPIPADKLSAKRVALHEMGHAIGLRHNSNCPDNVMEGTIPRGCVTMALGSSDIAAVQSLYGCQHGLLQTLDLGATCIPDFNPASEISDFNLRSGIATWTVRHEWETREYVLEGCNDLEGTGLELATDDTSLGIHRVELGIVDFPYVRLVEVEESGRRLFRSYDVVHRDRGLTNKLASSLSSVAPSRLIGAPRVNAPRAQRIVIPPPSVPSSPTVVLYTIPELVAAVEEDVVPFWEEMGNVVEVIDVAATFPPGTELEGIKASIANYAAGGTKNFHLVGAWQDDYPPELWSTSPYWQSKYDAYHQVGVIPADASTPRPGIPTFRMPDDKGGPDNTAQMAPYIYTDQWYADTDDDNVPDVVVTRWPFSEPSEVAAAAARLPSAQNPAASLQRALFLVGDKFPKGPGSIELTRAMADEVKNRLLELNPAVFLTTMFQSDYPEPEGRNYGTAWALNFIQPDLIVGLATDSDEYHPCDFFVKQSCSDPPLPGWNMQSLGPGSMTRLVLAASCESAQWPYQTYICHTTTLGSPDYPIEVPCKEFLSNDGAGALAWIGPTTGTLQGANYTVARFVVEELVANPYRPMAESWLVAMRRAYSIATPEYVPTLQAYAFLGDPLSPYRRLPDHSIVAKVLRTNGSVGTMPAAFAVGCPKGDWDKIVVEVTLDAIDVLAALPATALTLFQPANNSVFFFPAGAPAVADSAASLVAQTNQYRTTFTVRAFNGFGIGDALVSLFGIPLGYAHLNVKSFDFDVNVQNTSFGKVSLPDFVAFGNAYTSTPCRCLPNYPKAYNPRADYALPDTTVSLPDFTSFGPHYNHEVQSGSGESLVAAEASAGTVRLELEEFLPLIGEHTLRATVSLDGVESFAAAVLALRNENPKLEFIGWSEATGFGGETVCAEVVRDGRRECFIGVLGREGGSNGTTTLGKAEFRVLSEGELPLSDEDLALVTADLLPSVGGRQLAVASVAVQRSIVPVVYTNALAQNYPNPFNPSTTISFSLERSNDANLSIYDVRGALVRRLVEGRQESGVHRVVWDGMNSDGQRVASGVYFYKLVTGPFTDTKKMTILK